MAQFEASALLDVSIDEGSLRSARRTIEDELGGVDIQSPRPTGGGGGGAIGSRGPEPATIDLSRKRLGELEVLVDLTEEQNDILESLSDGGFGGGGGGLLPMGTGAAGGGGGFLSGAAGGIAASAAGGLSALLPILGATTAATAGTAAVAEQFFDFQATGKSPATRNVNIKPEGKGGKRPGAQGIFKNVLGFFSGLKVPEGGTTDKRQFPFGDLSRAGGPPSDRTQEVTQETNINPEITVNANVDGVDEQQVKQISQRNANQAAEEIRRRIERSLGSGSSPRTTGNPAGPTGGPGSSGPTPF